MCHHSHLERFQHRLPRPLHPHWHPPSTNRPRRAHHHHLTLPSATGARMPWLFGIAPCAPMPSVCAKAVIAWRTRFQNARITNAQKSVRSRVPLSTVFVSKRMITLHFRFCCFGECWTAKPKCEWCRKRVVQMECRQCDDPCCECCAHVHKRPAYRAHMPTPISKSKSFATSSSSSSSTSTLSLTSSSSRMTHSHESIVFLFFRFVCQLLLFSIAQVTHRVKSIPPVRLGRCWPKW